MFRDNIFVEMLPSVVEVMQKQSQNVC